jgi:hypothetical protein
MRRSFQSAFCDHFGCAPEEYVHGLFWRCLYRHARPVAALLLRSRPAFFEEDFAFARDLAAAGTRREVINELNRFFGRNQRDKNWMRKTFAIRISGKRVLRLYRELSRSERERRRAA